MGSVTSSRISLALALATAVALSLVATAVSVPQRTSMLPTGLLEVLVAGLLLIVIGSLVFSAVRQRVVRCPLAPQAGNERE